MDGEKRKCSLKLAKHRAIDNDAESQIILNIRQQQKGTAKQPAQERLKRLQTNLKQSKSIKVDKERPATKRSTRNSSLISSSPTSCPATNSAPSTSATATFHSTRKAGETPAETPRQSKGFFQSLKNFCFPEKPRPVPATVKPQASSFSQRCGASAVHKSASASHIGAKNAWAKPTALLDASNRLERNRSISANQRLVQLRESLQQQQKESNNNKCETTLPSKKLPTNQRSVKTSPLPDAVEPMDIDWQEEEDDAAASSSATVVSKSQHDLSLNKSHNESEQEDISDIKMQRLLTTGQDLPARRLDHMYFVLDTNVLMDNLLFVEDLCHVALGETNGSMLYIPYIVIKELDKLKDRRDDNELKRLAAIRAIRYLNKKFDESLKIQGQSALEEADHLIEVDCPDDSIVNCCLQLQTQVPHLMLLTNDNNLRLKANASAIQVSCRSDLLNDYRPEFDALPS
ncbi:transcriptional protein SWT1 [Drosophila virilis]|uniref:PIN domain-containing protein n=1 Tax=Drosophila virilis TaxID=7244 RepID=B4M6R2_DROVI|nr:transcriptional protein SWT1 [Drosophila virilis]EDW62479.1 uncharacterized protein Dvir_GJ16833 [Drosophila virilis]